MEEGPVFEPVVYEVAVLGAGVIGSATAYYLTSRGTRSVLLLEQVRARPRGIMIIIDYYFCPFLLSSMLYTLEAVLTAGRVSHAKLMTSPTTWS